MLRAVPLPTFEVLDIRRAEAVDTLIGISDNGGPSTLLGKQIHQLIRDDICVLKLIPPQLPACWTHTMGVPRGEYYNAKEDHRSPRHLRPLGLTHCIDRSQQAPAAQLWLAGPGH